MRYVYNHSIIPLYFIITFAQLIVLNSHACPEIMEACENNNPQTYIVPRNEVLRKHARILHNCLINLQKVF